MKRAIVIGASSGIGREVAKLLLANGWLVGIAARREDLLMEVKAINPGMIEVMRIDVTAADAQERLLELAKRLGGVNLFVYCSGIGKQNPELDTGLELTTVDVNVKGFAAMVGTIFNYMAENLGGDIAVISSIAGTKGLGVAPSYSATKAFQNTYIQALEQLSNMTCFRAADAIQCLCRRRLWRVRCCVRFTPTAMCTSSTGVTACWFLRGG